MVADNVLALDQKWWLRVATRNDAATSREERDRLGALANSVMRVVDVRCSSLSGQCHLMPSSCSTSVDPKHVLTQAIVKNSEQDITQSSEILQVRFINSAVEIMLAPMIEAESDHGFVLVQRILASAADANGEWQLPLSEDAVAAMSRAMDANADLVDEALLSYAYAYLRKAHKDKIPGSPDYTSFAAPSPASEAGFIVFILGRAILTSCIASRRSRRAASAVPSGTAQRPCCRQHLLPLAQHIAPQVHR